MRLVRVGLVLGLIATAACGGDDDTATTTVPPETTGAPTTAPPTSPPPATDPPATDPPVTEPPVTDPPATDPPPTVPATTEPPVPTTEPPAPTTTEPPRVDVRLYFTRDERLAIAHRGVTGPAVLRGALNALLDGPASGETTAGLQTQVPAGTSLLDVNLADGLATVDLSADFEAGGGTLSMVARVAQVVFTATQFPNVDLVEFWMEGEPIDFLGGEGIPLDEPLSRTTTERVLTGGIIFDTPAPGDTVTSPFTVTGEGDVYEGDFPVFIRRDGVELGDVTIVRAGAWGEWADFEATITVDADPGPFELVAYDESGCGPPECPEPVEIVIPLVLAG